MRSPGEGSRRACRGFVLLLAGLLPLGAQAALPPAQEHEVKAAFIYNFTKFVEWPANRFEQPAAPLVIGVAGNTPVATALQIAVRGRYVNEHPLQVVMLSRPEDARQLHLLFIPAAEEHRLAGWIAAAAGAGVLTVGESTGFLQRGGAINFVQQADRVRFEIHLGAAEHAGLRVSAQLLKLAIAVRQDS